MDYPIYHNNSWKKASEVHVSIFDVGFLRGYGIFDFFRIMNGRPVFMDDHLDRFLSSAQKMGIHHTYQKNDLANIILELAAMSKDECLGVKMVLSAGDSLGGFEPTSGSQLFVIPNPFQFTDFEKGMKLKSFEFQREMADIKSLNYAFALRNWTKIKSEGFDEYIYFTTENGVTECSRSNLFLVKNGIIITPKSGILEGITRKKIIEICQKNKFSLEIRDVSLQEFHEADEVFTTGSTKRVVPIKQIDDTFFEIGAVTRRLNNLIMSYEL